jgi:hypothetical protein
LPLGNEEQQQPHMKEVPIAEAPKGLKELKKPAFFMTMKSMLGKKFK